MNAFPRLPLPRSTARSVAPKSPRPADTVPSGSAVVDGPRGRGQKYLSTDLSTFTNRRAIPLRGPAREAPPRCAPRHMWTPSA
eukprot:scaffold109_cov389-Prasinococcus_capsulatus_cf.AAC.8